MPGSFSSERSMRTSASSPSRVRWYPVLASIVVVPNRSHSPSRSRTPLHRVPGSVPRVTVTVEPIPPPATAHVLHRVPVDDVLDHAGQALREFRGPADPGDAVVVGEDRRIAPDLGS